MRIVELSLIKILNKQLFLAGEVKMIRLIILITTFLGLAVGSANADPKKIIVVVINLIILTSPAKNNCLFNIFNIDHSTILKTIIQIKMYILSSFKKRNGKRGWCT